MPFLQERLKGGHAMISLMPIDVGFDLKRDLKHPTGRFKKFCVNVPPGTVEITYENRSGKKTTFKGTAREAVKVLKRAGFCAQIAKQS